MPKLLRNGDGSYFITIPIDIVRAKKWIKGQFFGVAINTNGNLELFEVKK